MSLILLLGLSAGWAQDGDISVVQEQALSSGILFLGMAPDPALYPTLKRVQPSDILPAAVVNNADRAALSRLALELEAVKPLAEEFDGELAIMSRLKAATDSVTALQDPADRDLVYRALVFQGYAVARYFQSDLGSDPAADGYRGTLNEKVVPQAWIDAAALDPARAVGEELLSEEAERLAFDDVRAEIQLAPKATVRVVGATPGTALVVDGGAPQSATLGVPVAPGRHWVRVEVDGESVARASARVTRGQDWTVEMPAMTSDLDLLVLALAEGPEALALQDRVVRAFESASHQPLLVAVQGKEGTLVYEVQGSSVILIDEEEDPDEAPLYSIHAALGLGWMYDGDWFLSKPDRVPHTRASVNAVLPVGTLSAQLRPGPFALSLGVDVGMPAGADNTLASGSMDLRVRAHPHIGFGVPVAQLTVGYLFPWHLGLGARAQVPIGESFSLGAATVYGQGLEQAQPDNPLTGTYQPAKLISAWGFLSMSFR